jgi:hypothetical protein
MLELRELDGEIRVMKQLQEVLEAAPTYFERVMGYARVRLKHSAHYNPSCTSQPVFFTFPGWIPPD